MKRILFFSLGFCALFFSVSPGYGQQSGIGVYDADGWTILVPGADSRIVYVSHSEGDDANDGLSPDAPRQTIEAGAALMRDGYPDHLLLKRGDTWIMGKGLGAFHSGRSAAEPMVVAYYGEQGDRPMIKTEGPFVWVQEQNRSNLAFVGLELYAYKHDPNSPDYESESGVSGISMIAASGENILIEDCKFSYVQMGAYTTGQGEKGSLRNLNFRRNICLHSWAGDSYTIHELRTRVQGMYISGVDGILIEENLFDHNGWDEQIEGAGATMFNHNIYMSTANQNWDKIIVRGNILARASAHGLQLRSGGWVEDNLFVQNAINLNVGYHASASMPGARGIVKNNVFQEVRLMDSTNVEYPRTASVRGIGEITIPAVIENNILSHCINEAQFGIDNYQDKWGFGGELVLRNNIVYKWTVKSEKPEAAWPDPERRIGDYHKLLGKEASTVAFLLEARKRPLKTWWPDYSAKSVNEFIRNGFIQTDKIYLWPGEVPGMKGEKNEPVLAPDKGDRVIRIAEVTNPSLEVFRPERSKHNGAGIIVCPGGGYHHLAVDKEGYEVAKWLAELGYTAFVLQYRVPDQYDGALSDIQRAIRVVRSRAGEWRLNTGKIGVLGFSAGASLSARAGTDFDADGYPGVDKIDEASCRPDCALRIYAGLLNRGVNKSLSPDVVIKENTPPMFIFGTADDTHANSNIVIAQALRDAGIPVELHLMPEGGHGYGLRKGNVAAETWPIFAEAWLMRNVQKEEVSYHVQKVIPTNAPEKLVSLLNELAAKESNPLLKEHFEAVARFTLDTTHGFQITEENMEDASRVLQFFQNEGSRWESYVDGPRPLIISFKSPTDGKYSYYQLFLPKGFDPDKTDYPFYMELHGSGGGRNDNPRKQLFMPLQHDLKGVTLQGYLKQGLFIYPWGRGDKWYRGIAESDIHEALADFDRRFTTDPRRQYIYGFSMGGGGAFRFSQESINRWSAVGIYSGAIFDLKEEEASAFKNTPVWMVWGAQEDKIGKTSKALKELFLKEGVDLYWKEIEGVGHSYLGAYQENLMEWFTTKEKKR